MSDVLPDALTLNYHWRDFAECKGMDPDLFFPERGDNVAIRNAKEVCGTCLVREECLEYALEAKEDGGIWGGYTVADFKRIRRARDSLA